MFTQIIEDISKLKRNYNHKDNTYEVLFYNLEESYFLEKLNNILKLGSTPDILDNKEYIKNDRILNIDINGYMTCIKRKKLKYINYDNNCKVNLVNYRKDSVINFNTSNEYDDVYRQKKIIFDIKNIKFVFVIKTKKKILSKKDEEKIQTDYEIIISFKSYEDENKIKDIFSYL